MPTKSILVIEREASLGEVLSECLSELAGWQVILSPSIQEGISLCMAHAPDGILLDASLAETDALLFTEQLKQYAITRSIPIILITARASWFTLNQFNQMGFAGAITKPFDPFTLPTQVSHLLGWVNVDD